MVVKFTGTKFGESKTFTFHGNLTEWLRGFEMLIGCLVFTKGARRKTFSLIVILHDS